jgi:predicted DNA-binding transcriptional regulator YafY
VHPSYQHALDAALKIESQLPKTILDYCGAWLDGVSIRWPQTTPVDAVSDVFQSVQRALAQRMRIKVKYDSVYDRGEIVDVLEPMRLIFMSRGWYLIARSLKHRKPRTFKMDRMVEVTPLDDPFEPDPSFSEKAYFGAAWRMIPEGTIYSIKLRFSAEVAASVEEVRWHDSQRTTRLDDGRLLFEAQVDGLREISSWILSYADRVEVLAPLALRRQVGEKAARVASLAAIRDDLEDGR